MQTPNGIAHVKKPTKSTFFFISMASILFLSLVSLTLYLSLSSAATHNHHMPPSVTKPKPKTPTTSVTTAPPEIQAACKATRFPDACQTSLSPPNHVPPNPTPLQIIQSAISVSSDNLKTAQSMVKSILDASAASLNRTTAAKNCLEFLTNSQYRISSTVAVLPGGRVKDARAWMSAALLSQYDCWSALKYANDTSMVNKTMAFLNSLTGLTSNALSMLVSYDHFGNETASWKPPQTERDGFWEQTGPGGVLGFGGGFPSKLNPDVTVCKDGSSGCYKTVQEAVNAAPDNEPGRRFVIGIKAGVYEETVRVPLEKKNVVFLGDGMSKTVITGSLNVGQPGISTYNTATVVSRNSNDVYQAIHQACEATRDHGNCEFALIHSDYLPQHLTPLGIIQAAVFLSHDRLNASRSMVESILLSSAANSNLSIAAGSCLDVLGYSLYRHRSTAYVLPLGRIKDARAWMSAALSYQHGCLSGFKSYANDSLVNKTMPFLELSAGLTGIALSMLVSYDVFGNDTGLWRPPETERDGFWEGAGLGGGSGAELGFRGGIPSKLTADVTVCKDASNGCYVTVQDAVRAAPDNMAGVWFVIYIKEGVYEETVRIPLEKKNVVFLGDGMGKTVITGSLSVGQDGITTYNTATVGVLGDGFMASGITFQNTAGPDAHQAVAFRSDSDLSVIENCEFIGNQDTLYAHSLRQFYKSCRIQGNVDFIFGNSAAIFQDCQILVAPRQVKPEKGENNAVTAHGRTDPAQSTGFVFQNCLINGTEEYMRLYHSKPSVHKNFLGRPWKEYSRTVFIRCNLEALITPQGWMPWSGEFALKTLYYGEFENMGLGSNLSQRATWSSRVPAEHVDAYSVQNFIQGDEWIPTSS